MNPTRTPSAVVAEQAAAPQLPDGDGERFTGSGVMGLPFTSGHCLALRDMTATSIGPAYRTLWHRDPDGEWTIFTNTDPELSCPRYFGAACRSVERVDAIDVGWTDDHSVRVRIGDRLDWRIELAASPSTRMMSRMGSAMPTWAWRSEALMGAMGPMSGPMLRVGRIRLRGQTPNRQHFRVAPLRLWRVTDSSGVLDGADLGRPEPLDRQDHLGDFWLPQRGLFYLADAVFEAPADAVFEPPTDARSEAPADARSEAPAPPV